MTSPLRVLRQIVAPAGRHRPGATQPTPLLRPDDLVANKAAYCPAEQRTTFHGMHRDGSRHCWTCRTNTPGE
ncbi:hypothetical protein ACFYQQ_00980 [Streptomyces sp. NPDC005496]|uniref:hypothetical protein n=1 Tax=unclassified Streptomyces TaxID=2593676 RepID=UPI0033BC3273